MIKKSKKIARVFSVLAGTFVFFAAVALLFVAPSVSWAFTQTYTNGAGGAVTIPAGVIGVSFNARGGAGGTGGSYGSVTQASPTGGGGNSSYAYVVGSGAKILGAGGGGGGGGDGSYNGINSDYSPLPGGGGGYTGGNIGGSGGSGSLSGNNGGVTGGGIGGNAYYGSFYIFGGIGGVGTDGVNSWGAGGGINGSGGNTTSLEGAGGGGGIYSGGGGGGGYSADSTSYSESFGGGGGGGGYLHPSLSTPDVNGFVSIPLSAIGSPSQIYIQSGAGGSKDHLGYGVNGAGGTITISWADPGTVNVSSNISSSWTITGPSTITGSGTSQSVASPPGTYTIIWGTVSGYTAPASEILTLTSGSTITFNGSYTAIPTDTTIGNDTNPGNVTVAPESGIIDLDFFTLATSAGTDSVTALTVTLAAGTNAGLSEVRITDSTGATTYFSAVANPASNVINFSGGSAIPVSTAATTYKIRITPKTHANMPAVPGVSYATAGTVTAFTSTNAQSGTDSASATITVDNLSPADVTASTATAGNTQVALSWTNPAVADFSNVLILRNTVSVASVPAEGSSPLTDTNCGGTCIVAYVGTGTSYIDTGLTNGTPYYYKIFAKDINGNYSASGATPSGSPATPVSAPTVTLSANPTTVLSSGSSSMISWSSTDATSCSAVTPAGWTASTATSGSQAVTVTSATTYSLSCTGPGGTMPGSVTVSISIPISYAVTQSGVSDFQGWAWGSDVMGWISFNSINTGAAYPYKVYVVGTLPCSPPTASNLQSNFTDRCVGPFSPTIGFTYKDNQLNPLAEYTVRIYDSAGPALVDTFTVTYCDSNNNNYIDATVACGGADNATTPLAYSGTLIHAGSSPPIPSSSGISITYSYSGTATMAYGHSYYYTVTVQSMCNLN